MSVKSDIEKELIRKAVMALNNLSNFYKQHGSDLMYEVNKMLHKLWDFEK